MKLLSIIDPVAGEITGQPVVTRRLSDLQGVFADPLAYEKSLQSGDPVVYTLSAMEYPGEAGNLNYAVGRMYPGKIGAEYFMTKGHFHDWRAAAEIYIGLSGEGCLLLESEDGAWAEMIPLRAYHAIFVPGHTAHRTMNTGKDPLIYLGIYPAQSGHDYGSIARQNFRHVIVEIDGSPTLLPRAQYLSRING